jgi:membrane associated rhomboid family serine protease/outer membrane protein assembly factor BamD (BamD/ComL family)
MLLPYNVDRPTRRVPFVTYWLIGINTFIFLLTVVVANINWSAEREQVNEQIEARMRQSIGEDSEAGDFDSRPGDSSDGESGDTTSDVSDSGTGSDSGGDSSAPGSTSGAGSPAAPVTPGLDPNRPGGLDPNRPGGPGSSSPSPGSGTQSFGVTAFQAPGVSGTNAPGSDAPGSSATNAPGTGTRDTRPGSEAARKLSPEEESEMYKMAWHLEHRKDAFVMEPYPTTLDTFAYHATQPTLLGMFTAMFMHGGLEHLLGNMLMLWLFGRALEDVLGHWVYLGAYLVCGIAATFLFHVMIMTFAADAAGGPALGASGAIAGVLGAFAPRFYRTPVSIFYTNFYGFRILSLGSAVLGGILAKSMGTPGLTLGFLIVLALLVWWGEDAAWGQFQAAAVWVIAFWIVAQNIVPALLELHAGVQGGIAYWAHIGGFGFGMLYALLIGSKSEGKAEYLIQDARRALDNKYATNALENAIALQKLKPNDPVSYQLLAEAYDHKNENEKALDNYEIAIDKYIKNNDRECAARLYLEALHKHPLFIMPPATQFTLASHLATVGEYGCAAENLAKIPFTYPDAPENEKSLMGAAQLYLKQLKQPQMAYTMLSTLLQRYPESQYKLQAENGIKMAQHMIANPDPAEEAAKPKVWEPSTKKISEVQAQQVQAQRK